ncbi:hypothetical protein Q5P01_020062 [Channa striata]|uniref:Uncharacterized protein n=1 Tax=Channa striata TaxID=64152 RepID=A0AA88S1G1_CHASR|nr:hypothetical protein Q5P01_020062 [Channa striata]
MECALQRQITRRKAMLGQLTEEKSYILHLMDDCSMDVVETKLMTKFNQLFSEFCHINISLKGLLQGKFRKCCDIAARWNKEAHQRTEEATQAHEDVNPEVGVSLAQLEILLKYESSVLSSGSKTSEDTFKSNQIQKTNPRDIPVTAVTNAAEQCDQATNEPNMEYFSAKSSGKKHAILVLKQVLLDGVKVQKVNKLYSW